MSEFGGPLAAKAARPTRLGPESKRDDNPSERHEGEFSAYRSLRTSPWSLDSPVPTQSLSDQIANRISQRILGDAYKPGERILEQRLAAEFRVSRGPIRDALRILEREGLVQINPRHGAQVTLLSVEEVRDIFNIRACLIGLAIKLVASQGNCDVINSVIANIEEMTQAEKQAAADAYIQLSYETSILFGEASGNKRLTAMISSLALQTLRYTRLGLSTPQRRAESRRLWVRLAKALKKGRIDEAEQLGRQLVLESRDMAVRLLSIDA